MCGVQLCRRRKGEAAESRPILFGACRFSTLHFVLCVCGSSEVCHDFEEQDVAAETLEESCDVTSWLP